MSTLGIRLKRRAGILAAGLTLSAATLAIVPGIAEAQNLGSAQNTNSANHTIDQAAVQNGVDSGANINGSPNASLASPGSYQGTTNQQDGRGSFGSTQQNTNAASHTVGQVAAQDGANVDLNTTTSPNVSVLSSGSYQETANQQTTGSGSDSGGTQQVGETQHNYNQADHTIGQAVVQDGVNLNANANISPNTTALSPDSYQESGNIQNVYGDSGNYGGTQQNYNSADYTVGQIATQDGVNSSINANVSPNASVLSPGSYQETANQQSIGASNTGGSYGGGQNTNDASYTVGQAVVQDGVSLDANANISPNVSVLSPGSEQSTGNYQSIEDGNGDGAANDNSANHTIGQVAVQDGVNLNSNVDASPNASVLSPGSYQETSNHQDMSGGNSDASADAIASGGHNYNQADHTIGQAVVQDGVNLDANVNISPNASVLSPGSKQEGSNEQGINSSVSNSGSSDNGETYNVNEADHTVGQAVLQNGVNGSINANVSPNASVLSPGSEQKTDNTQTTDASETGGSGNENSNNGTDHSIGQVVGQNLAKVNTNANVSPNVSVLSPSSKQETRNRQNIGDGSSATNDDTQNTNSAEQTIGQIVVQDGADLNNNLNVSPNASVLSPGSYQQTDNNQSISGGGNGGGGGNDNRADHTIGQIVLQNGVNLNSNTNLSPNASVLSPGSEQKTDNCQSIGGGDCTATDPGNGGTDPGNGDTDPGNGGNDPGEGTPPDHLIPPPDDQLGGDPGDSDVVGNKPGGGGSDHPNGGGIVITGDDRPDGRSPSPRLADVPEVDVPRLIDPPMFVFTPYTLERSSVTAKLGLADTMAIGGSTLPSALGAPVDTLAMTPAKAPAMVSAVAPALAPALAPAVLASSEPAPHADGAQADGGGASVSSLPKTGGGEVWMAALGLLLLFGGLISIRKLRKRSPIAS